MDILVGMSGGVDSSTAALLLKEAGHNVIGATMTIWGDKGLRTKFHKTSVHGACLGPDEKEDIEAARQVCNYLGIDFYVFDCSSKYDEIVLNNFKKEYLKGRTPNPCVWCNSLIKFDVLPYIAKENGIMFDKFATGHYARIDKTENRYLLKQGINLQKDQSYFLYRLKQKQLENILLPLGDYTKEEIREIAKSAGLEVADKPDSQDFYAGDYNELLEVKNKSGNIINTDGKILGTHNEVWNYTVGQRKGLGISSSEPIYVIELRGSTNEVVVGYKDKTFKDSLIAEDLNWIAFDNLEQEISCEAKIRSTQKPARVKVKPIEQNKIEVKFEDMQNSIAPGQSVVFYDEDIVLGGGIIA